MKRSLGIFIAGVAIGLLLAFAIIGRGRNTTASKVAGAVTDKNSQTTATVGSPSDKLNFEDDKILLGNITAVPFQELYGVLSRRTPAEIAQLAQQLDSLPNGKDSTEKIAAFFKAWSHLDSASAFKAATSLKTAEARSVALRATIDGADVSAASALAKSMDDLAPGIISLSDKAGLLGNAVSKWAKVDPVSAAKFLDTTTAAGMNYTMAWYSVAESWAAIDPQAALAWTTDHTTGFGAQFARNGLMSGWWQKDHAAAEAYAAAHAGTPDGKQFVSSIAGRMFNEDPKKAAAWVNQLPNADARKMGDGIIAVQWATTDPRAASNWAASLPGDEAGISLESTVGMWAQGDPQAAGEWLDGLSGRNRDYAIGRL